MVDGLIAKLRRDHLRDELSMSTDLPIPGWRVRREPENFTNDFEFL
jgi:hypothetical protein